MAKDVIERQYLRLIRNDDDSVTADVMIVPCGVPEMHYEFPAPLRDLVQLEAKRAEIRLDFWREGLFIARERQVRNPVFDRKGERSTTRFVVRPCKTAVEATFVGTKIHEWIASIADEAV